MANHGFIITTKWVTQKKLLATLREMSLELFHGNLEFDICTETDTYIINYKSPADDRIYATRVLWRRSNRKLEIRHSGGSDFTWWLDAVICETFAEKFNGYILDDGHRWEGCVARFPTFEDFVKAKWPNSRFRDALINNAMRELDVPPEFRLSGDLVNISVQFV